MIMNHLITIPYMLLSIFFIVIGAGLTATILGAVIGIPLMLLGLWFAVYKSKRS